MLLSAVDHETELPVVQPGIATGVKFGKTLLNLKKGVRSLWNIQNQHFTCFGVRCLQSVENSLNFKALIIYKQTKYEDFIVDLWNNLQTNIFALQDLESGFMVA